MMTWAWSVGSPVHWFVPSRSTWPLAKVKKQKPTPPFIKMNFLLCLSSPFVSPCVLVIIITKTTDTTVFLSQRPFYQSYSSLLRSRWIRTPETLTPEHITVHSCLFFQNCLFLPWSLPLPFMLNGWHPCSRRLKRYCQWLMQAKNKHETSNSLCLSNYCVCVPNVCVFALEAAIASLCSHAGLRRVIIDTMPRLTFASRNK